MQKFNTKMWNLVRKTYTSNPHFGSSGTPINEWLATKDRPIREVVCGLEFDPLTIRIFEFGMTCECSNGDWGPRREFKPKSIRSAMCILLLT